MAVGCSRFRPLALRLSAVILGVFGAAKSTLVCSCTATRIQIKDMYKDGQGIESSCYISKRVEGTR